MLIHLHDGQSLTREQLLEKPVNLQCNRNDITLVHGQLHVFGKTA